MTALIPLQCRIANLLATFLLLLFAVVVLYAFGNFAPEHEWTRTGPQGDRTLRIGFVGVELQFGPPRPTSLFTLLGSHQHLTRFDFLGLSIRHNTLGSYARWHETAIRFPWWLLVVPFLPRRIYRRLCRMDEGQRCGVAVAKPTHCPVCGYDLRATSRRCPECGAIPVA